MGFLIGTHAIESFLVSYGRVDISSLSVITLNFSLDKLWLGLGLLFLWENWQKMKWGVSWDLWVTPLVILLGIVVLGLMSGWLILDFPKSGLMTFLLWFTRQVFFVVLPEELFFRGFIQQEAVKVFPQKTGMVLFGVAVLFALSHGINSGFPYILAGGLAYGFVYYRSGGNVLYSSITHLIYNSVHYLVFVYQT